MTSTMTAGLGGLAVIHGHLPSSMPERSRRNRIAYLAERHGLS
jgi:hypothetical protein